ncbi:carbon-nitrogen hydrolase family protein [uncultured Roseobacter sp.]|uniref:carbon-nitrogen hydrolase family protein n=1 Tax=uncultured Roseobacter sp. TaxID=114847 RepID=UPI0026394F11|nr:carbon-nitrogen hydrolase family protein [uncultured Roseobacter sp.]
MVARKGPLVALTFGVAGCAIGAAAWNDRAALLPLATLFPLCFGLASTRLSAITLSMGYFLAASRGLPVGAATFFGSDIAVGLLLWLAASSVFVLIHGALWSARPARRAFGFAGATILMAIPPLGILGWVSPVTAAGVLLPGFGWAGLLATLGLLMALAYGKARHTLLGLTCVLWTGGALMGEEPNRLDGWEGLESNVHYSAGSRDFQRSFTFVTEAKWLAAQSNAPIVVFPEGAMGWRTHTAEWAWKDLAKHSGKTIFAGVEDANGKGYDNALARVTSTDVEIVYRQRMPVPVSMWRPWSERSAKAHFDQAPMVMLEGRPTAVLICYEQLLVWPVLQSRYAGADHVLGIASLWWADGTSIPGIQMTAMTAWARLFNMSLTVSFNR